MFNNAHDSNKPIKIDDQHGRFELCVVLHIRAFVDDPVHMSIALVVVGICVVHWRCPV